MDGFTELISQLPIAALMRKSDWAYPLISTVHILAIGLIIGSVVVLDLRLLGSWRHLPLGEIAPVLSRTAAAGVGLALISGFLLFSVQAGNYLANPAFQIKLGMVTLALLNIACIHLHPDWRGIKTRHTLSLTIRFCAVFSLLLWVLTVAAGRWIAFV